jgi:hypothetical protein
MVLHGLRDPRHARHPPGLVRVLLVRQNDRFFELQVGGVSAPKIRVLTVRNTGFANQSSINSNPMSKANPLEDPESQNRHSHLMWAGTDVFGPLSAECGPVLN